MLDRAEPRIGVGRRVRALIHVSAWLALACITASQGILTYLATGGEVRVVTVLLLNLALWAPWAALSPLILHAARRLPLQGAGWPRRVVVHLAVNAACAVVAALLYRVLRVAIGIPPRGDYALLVVSGLNTALLVYWGLVAIAHAAAYYRRTEERRRQVAELDRNLAEARLEALRAQIHPHFLFNTLHAIASRIPQDPRGAQDMLGSLGELLRVHLRAAPGHEIPLREELALMERYLDIQQVRLRDRLVVEREVDPDTLEVPVPVLILQPLVENAIEHGIAQRMAGGILRVEGRQEHGRLHLVVTDRGDGGGEEPLDESRWSIGLTNTRERLRALYGDAQSLSVTRERGGVVRAHLTLPYRRGART